MYNATDVKALRIARQFDQAELLARQILTNGSLRTEGNVEVLRELGFVRRSLGDYHGALECYEVAIELAGALSNKGPSASLNINRAIALLRLNDLEGAEQTLGIAWFGWSDLDASTRILLLSTKSRLRRIQGHMVEAHELSMTAYSWAEKIGDHASAARARVALARSYASVGATEEALSEAFATVEMLTKGKDGQTLIDAYSTIYIAYHTLHRHVDGLTYARLAREEAILTGLQNQVCETSFNLSLALCDTDSKEDAFQILESVRIQTESLKIPALRARYLHTLGQLHLHRQDYHEAIRVLSDCIRLSSAESLVQEHLSAEFILAQAYRGIGSAQEAVSLAVNVISRIDDSGGRMDSLLASTLEFVASVEHDLGQDRNAYTHLHRLLTLRNMVNSEKARALAGILDVRYRVSRAEMRLRQLEDHTQRIEDENTDIRTQLAAAALRLVEQSGAQHRGRAAIDAQWRIFQRQFDRVHVGFVQRLITTFPRLSSAEVRICTMLTIPFSSKDIASILGCSVRTVEWHRANIRRKVGLSSHADLASSLRSIVTA